MGNLWKLPEAHPPPPVYFQNFRNLFLLLQELNPGSAAGVVAKGRVGKCFHHF